MPFDLVRMNLVEIDQDASLFRLAEFMIYSTSEHLHGRGEAHVCVYQRRDVHAMLAHFRIEELVVFLEILSSKYAVHVCLVSLDLQRLHRNHKFLLVFKMLEEEVLDKVSCLTVVFRIHRHLSEEVLHFRLHDRQRSKAVPKIVQSEKGLHAGLTALIFGSDEASSQLDRVWKVFLQEFL